MSKVPQFTTTQDAEQFAAQNGIVLTVAERRKITEIQAAERQRLTALAQDERPTTFADRWNAFYPRLLQTIISAGETLLTFSQTIIVSLGVPVVLVLLLIVEVTRVMHGITLFEADASLALFAATALVVLNLTLEITTHHIEHKAGYQEARARKWSLRIWLQNAAYTLGLGENWTAQEHSPAQRYKTLLSLVTFTILALALAGSMKTVIQATPGTWYEAIVAIATQSDLLTMLTWAGGLLFAAAAVFAAQGLSRYVAIRTVEIVAQMEARAAEKSDPHAAEIDAAGATVITAIIADKMAKQEARAAKARNEAMAALPPAKDGDTEPAFLEK